MNVLILTPDAVGGTLLNRMLAIYMQFHQFNRPVIDVGHFELGIEKCFSTDFNQEIVFHDQSNVRFQSCREIIDLLESVDHYKICKLPHYNMLQRNDPADQLLPFYQYLNQNFFIISCRRQNSFEHALSWGLNKITNALNVYSTREKVKNFAYFYKNKIAIDPISIRQSLEDYRKYIQWSETYFKIGSYYTYETHSRDIEKYVLSLPIFATQKSISTWKDVYGQDFNDWNRCHYFRSDLTQLALGNSQIDFLENHEPVKINEESIVRETQLSWQKFLGEYQKVADGSWPTLTTLQDYHDLPEHIKHECRHVHGITYELDLVLKNLNLLDNKYTVPTIKAGQIAEKTLDELSKAIESRHETFLQEHKSKYQVASDSIAKMKDLGILRNGIPIKKQTLLEKKMIIKNFDECLDVYNEWISRHPDLGSEITSQQLDQDIQREQNTWFPDTRSGTKLLGG